MALLAMAAAALCWVPAFLHCELRSMLMLQKNAGTRFPALRIHSEVAVVFLQAHSANELAHDNGPGSENPRAVLKITDPLDSAERSNVEPDDPLDFPRAIPYIEQNDRGLAVHLAECQPPGHGHT